MEIRKLLYATDLKEPTFDIMGGLLNIRKLGLEEVVLLHSMSAHLEDWKQRLSNYGIRSKALVEEGPSVPAILGVAQKEAVSFIVAHLDRGVRRPLRGSITRTLIKGASVPVLIIHKNEEILKGTNKGVFEHVMFATDWSPVSEKALEYLLNFKDLIKELDIVNVICHKLTVRDLRELKDRLADTRNLCLNQGIDAEFHIYAGKTWEEIVKAAKDYGATTIVMGTTRKPTFKELLSGSPSYRVAEEAAMPTLVVL